MLIRVLRVSVLSSVFEVSRFRMWNYLQRFVFAARAWASVGSWGENNLRLSDSSMLYRDIHVGSPELQSTLTVRHSCQEQRVWWRNGRIAMVDA